MGIPFWNHPVVYAEIESINMKPVTPNLNITTVLIEQLKPYKNNTRVHPPKQIQQLANAYKEFGFNVPIMIDQDYHILGGHGRVEAAKKVGMKEIPAIFINHLTEAQKRAFMIADNKIAANGSFDLELLKIEFEELATLNLNFDLEITGFETAEIDLLMDDPAVTDDSADETPSVQECPPITKLGDVWELGSHRLLCGNALTKEDYLLLLGEERADMIFTDPPYNVPVDGHVCGNGKVKHREFAMASGEMNESEFAAFLGNACANACEFSRNGSLHYFCMDWRHIATLIGTAMKSYTALKNICVWNKDNGGMGSFYRSKHELVAVFKHGNKPHVNNIELGKYGRYRTNVWDYKGVNSFGKNQADLKMHPTVKPVAMIADAIKDCTKRGHIVLDPFAGSGSTLIAAEKTARVARCIELDPHYCDVIIRRWEDYTGKAASLILKGDQK